jgi:predicted DNA-binding protein (MmcQ/YjbR family)
MRHADIERYCLSLPGATVHTPWGDSRVYKVAGKMFAMLAHDDRGHPSEVWFKAGEGSFEILLRQKGIRPCPYLARAKWVALESPNVLPPNIIKAYLSRAHWQVVEGLPKKKRMELEAGSDVVKRKIIARR